MTTIPLSPADLDAITTVVDEDDDVDPQTYLQGCLTAALNAWMVDPDDDRPEGEVIWGVLYAHRSLAVEALTGTVGGGCV